MFFLKIATTAGLAAVAAAQVVNQTVCNGKNYTYQELAGFGLIPGNARDQFGEYVLGEQKCFLLETLSGATPFDTCLESKCSKFLPNEVLANFPVTSSTIGGIGSAIALDRTQWLKLPNGSSLVFCGHCQTEDGKSLSLFRCC